MQETRVCVKGKENLMRLGFKLWGTFYMKHLSSPHTFENTFGSISLYALYVGNDMYELSLHADGTVDLDEYNKEDGEAPFETSAPVVDLFELMKDPAVYLCSWGQLKDGSMGITGIIRKAA